MAQLKKKLWPLILDDNEGTDPDSLGTGHMPLSTWGLHSASFENFGSWALCRTPQIRGVHRSVGMGACGTGIMLGLCYRKATLAKQVQIDCIFFCSPLSVLYSGREENFLGPWHTSSSALPLSRTLLKLSPGKARARARAEYWPRQGRDECCAERLTTLAQPQPRPQSGPDTLPGAALMNGAAGQFI